MILDKLLDVLQKLYKSNHQTECRCGVGEYHFRVDQTVQYVYLLEVNNCIMFFLCIFVSQFSHNVVTVYLFMPPISSKDLVH